LPVDFFNNFRPGQVEQVIQAKQILVPVFEPLPAEGGLIQLMSLDHGAHGAIEDHDPLPQQRLKLFGISDLCAHTVCVAATNRGDTSQTLAAGQGRCKKKINVS